MSEENKIKNPRGAGRKPLQDDEKSEAINVLLPKFMMEHVRENAKKLGYRSIAEYIRELVRRDMQQG